MSGGRPGRGSQRGFTVMWGARLSLCAPSPARVAHDVWHELGLEEMSDCDEDPKSIGDGALDIGRSEGSWFEGSECDNGMPR